MNEQDIKDLSNLQVIPNDNDNSSKNHSLKPTVVLVEDDTSIADVISYNLKKEGYKVVHVTDGETAISMITELLPDLVILDWMLPRKSGIEVCMSLRSQETTHNVPIIMISSRDDKIDRVVGLERGADDYITKPFSPIELMARMRAVLRRIRPAFSDKKLSYYDIEMDMSSYTVTRAGNKLKLAPIEFQILQSLMENPSRVLSREELIAKIWNANAAVDQRTVDVHITRLRKTLVSASLEGTNVIQTVRLAGYKLQPPEKDK